MQSLSRDEIDREQTPMNMDYLAYAALRSKLPVAIMRILHEKPHILDAQDLLRAGFPVKVLLLEGGYTMTEVLGGVRVSDYRKCGNLKSLVGAQESSLLPLRGPSARTVISYGDRQQIALWNTLSGKSRELSLLRQRRDVSCPEVVSCLLALPDGSIAVGSHEGHISHWDASKIECKIYIENAHSRRVTSLVLLPSGPLKSAAIEAKATDVRHIRVISGEHLGKVIRIWNLTLGSCEVEIKEPHSYFSHFTVLRDGTLLISSRRTFTTVWENTQATAPANKGISEKTATSVVSSLNPSLNMKVVLLGCGSLQTVALAELSNGLIASVSGSPDSGESGGIRLWNPALNIVAYREREELPVGWEEAVDDGVGQIGNTSTGFTGRYPSCVGMLRGGKTRIVCMCILGDGVTLATGFRDGTIGLWDSQAVDRNSALVRVLHDRKAWVWSIATLADGITIATTAHDNGTIQLWSCRQSLKAEGFLDNIASTVDWKVLLTWLLMILCAFIVVFMLFATISNAFYKEQMCNNMFLFFIEYSIAGYMC
jgi:WD40 repeat protein